VPAVAQNVLASPCSGELLPYQRNATTHHRGYTTSFRSAICPSQETKILVAATTASVLSKRTLDPGFLDDRCNEFAERARWDRWVHHDEVYHPHEPRNGRDILTKLNGSHG
jgi:hypothetical protein